MAAALLRSLATKIARAPPRLPYPYALERHGRLPVPASSGGLSRSRFFSTSSGSTPSSANLIRGPRSHNNKVPSDDKVYRAIVAINKAVTTATFFLLFGGFAFLHFKVNPALDRIHANVVDLNLSLATMTEDLKKRNERTRAILLSNEESQIESTDVSEGQRTMGVGTK